MLKISLLAFACHILISVQYILYTLVPCVPCSLTRMLQLTGWTNLIQILKTEEVCKCSHNCYNFDIIYIMSKTNSTAVWSTAHFHVSLQYEVRSINFNPPTPTHPWPPLDPRSADPHILILKVISCCQL